MSDSDLICVGLNHARTPVELREKVNFEPGSLRQALQEATQEESIEEAAILSTCNRMEIYVQGSLLRAPVAIETFLHRYHGIPDKILSPHLYHFQGDAALRQLMRVTASLDSLILGEPQILGQVKHAYVQAREHGALGPKLSKVFSQAFSTAKRVRNETALAKNAVTVAYAAVQLAQKVFGDLAGLKGLLIGAGKMGTLAASHFRQKGAYVEVARRGSDLNTMLLLPDWVVASATSERFLIEASTLKKIMRLRRYRPLFLIDIAVPRNIDPHVAELDNVYLYNIDDLSQVVAANLEERKLEAKRAEAIILEDMQICRQEALQRELAPIIREFQIQSSLIATQELEKLVGLTPEQNVLMQEFSRNLSSKLFHQGVLAIKKSKFG